MADDVKAMMEVIPAGWRTRWCGGEIAACACMGCVQIGNRIPMFESVTGRKFRGDPEYINETEIPKKVFDRLKVTKPEWDDWMRGKEE